MRVARAQTIAAEKPILQQIHAERAANLAKAQQTMGFAKAAAALLQGIAPRVQNTYSNAANADAGYAKGLSAPVQDSVNQQAASDNSFLTQMGTPQGGLIKPADVGGTAYGLEGYIPATSLQREGAAFTSAANMLPADALRQGQQSATGVLGNDPNLTSLQAELAKIAATQPATYQSIVKQMQDQVYRQASLGQAQQRIAIEQQNANTSAQHLNFDMTQANIHNRQEWARIGISKRSQQIRAAAAERKLKGGGFTPTELVGLKQKSYADAQRDFKGVPATTYANGSVKTKAIPKLTYKQALRRQVLNGIPPSIAIEELRAAGYKVPNTVGGKAGNDILGSIFSGPMSIRQTRTPQGARNAAFQMAAAQYGWGNAAQLRALDELVSKESGWNYKAKNKKSGALGIGQELGHKVPKGYINNPLVQIKWMLDYIQSRYGSPEAAWQHEAQNGWY